MDKRKNLSKPEIVIVGLFIVVLTDLLWKLAKVLGWGPDATVLLAGLVVGIASGQLIAWFKR